MRVQSLVNELNVKFEHNQRDLQATQEQFNHHTSMQEIEIKDLNETLNELKEQYRYQSDMKDKLQRELAEVNPEVNNINQQIVEQTQVINFCQQQNEIINDEIHSIKTEVMRE